MTIRVTLIRGALCRRVRASAFRPRHHQQRKHTHEREPTNEREHSAIVTLADQAADQGGEQSGKSADHCCAGQLQQAVTNLVLNGAIERFGAIRWIVPHAGGTLPFLAQRIASVASVAGHDPDAVLGALRGLHYDLACSANATSVRALLDLVDASRVLYGSDWPFTAEAGVSRGLGWVRGDGAPVPPAQLTANAAALLARG